MSLLKFLGLEPATPTVAAAAETDTVRKIVESMEKLEPARARYIAAFAYILSRVANADLKISAEETRRMERTVMEQMHLPEEQAILIVQIAKSQHLLFGATEDYLVTREFSKLATMEEKMALLHCLFSVAAADQNVSLLEDNVVRQIAAELKLEHHHFISVRLRYRDQLSVLKKPTS